MLYLNMLTSGRLNGYLADIEEQAQERFERALVHQGIVLLVPRRYGGRNQTRANAGAENRKG